MTNVFLQLVSLTKIISLMIIAVLWLRIIFRKAPRKLHKILWLLVGIRASIPFYFKSRLGVIPAQSVSSVVSNHRIVSTEPITRVTGMDMMVVDQSDIASKVDIATIVTYFWITGVVLFMIYLLVNYIRTMKNVSGAVRIYDEVYTSAGIPSPFILGYIKPRIYIDLDMNPNQQELIVAHERCHLKNMDHILKLIGFVLLGVYWFNPFMWLAYFLFCKDIEIACDEEVIKSLPFEKRKEYARTLLDSAHKANVLIYGVAFSENNVKERVVSIMNYKKPKFWIIVAAVVACVAVIILFFTVNRAPKDIPVGGTGYLVYEFETYDGQKIVIDDSNIISQTLEENVLESTSVPEGAVVIAPGRDYVYLEDENYYYVEDAANGLLTVASKDCLVAVEVVDGEMDDYTCDAFSISYSRESFYAFEDADNAAFTLSYAKEGVELAGSNVVTFQVISGVDSKTVMTDKVKAMDGSEADIVETTIGDGAVAYAYDSLSESEGSELRTEQIYYTIQRGDDVIMIDEFRTVSPDEAVDKAVSSEIDYVIQSIKVQ